MSFYVYILYSAKLDRYYIGHTSDLIKRFHEHNTGLSTYTSKGDLWVVVHQEAYDTRQQAQNREQEIKKKKSRKYIEWLISA
jgi:putative endonuclease